MYQRIHSAVREAYQARIGQRNLTSNLRVHLNPNFRESGLHTYIHGPDSAIWIADSDFYIFFTSSSSFVRLFCNLLNDTDVGTSFFRQNLLIFKNVADKN